MCHNIPMGEGKRFSATLAAGADPAPIVLGALDTAETFAEAAQLDPRSAARLAVVVEELVTNALRHGAAGGPLAIEMALTRSAEGIAIALQDDGVAFDPTARRAFAGPDSETGGGVGLALVRAWAGSLAYRRDGGRNRLDVVVLPAGP